MLLDDPLVSGLAVNVETFKGVVQLSCFVKTRAERDRAAELARKVGGMKAVKNAIRIRQMNVRLKTCSAAARGAAALNPHDASGILTALQRRDALERREAAP